MLDARPRAADERAGDLDLVRRSGKRRGVVETVCGVEQPRDRRHARRARAHLAAESRRGDADERERPALPVHRLQVGARVRLRHVELEDQLAGLERRRRRGRRRSAAGRARRAAARAASCATSRRARAARPRGRTDARRRRARCRRSRARGAAPSRAWQRSPPCRQHGNLSRQYQQRVAWQEVAADRAHRAQLRRRGEPARLAQRVRDLRVGLELGERRARADRRPVDRRAGRRARTSTSVSASRSPSRSSGTSSVPPASASEPLPSAAAASSSARRPQELHAAPSPFRAPRAARAASPRA